MDRKYQVTKSRLSGKNRLQLCLLMVLALIGFTSIAAAEEGKLYQITDTDLQRVIVMSPELFSDFQGVKIKPFSPDKLMVESNRKNWKKNTLKYMPELTTQLNEKIRVHNANVADIDDSKLLVAELQFGKVLYQRGVVIQGNRNVNSRIKGEDDDYLVQDNPSEVVVAIKVVFSHPETEQMLGMADHIAHYYSYKRSFLGEKIESYVLTVDTTWEKRNQDIYWGKISDFALNRLEPTLQSIKAGKVTEFK